MWTSYQAASGILPLVVLGMVTEESLQSRQSIRIRRIFSQVWPFAAGYLLASIVFLLIPTSAGNYRDTDMYPLNQLLSGVIYNLCLLRDALKLLLGAKIWLILLILVVVVFTATLVSARHSSIKHKLQQLALGLLLITVGLPLSYGAFLVLQSPPTWGRSLLGVGVYLSIVAIIAIGAARTSQLRLASCLPIYALTFSFLSYAFTYGNALSSQWQYAQFRIENLASTLSQLAADSEIKVDSQHVIQLSGDIEWSPVMEHVASLYPVTSIIFDDHSELHSGNDWGYVRLVSYYGIGIRMDINHVIQCDQQLIDDVYQTIGSDNHGNVCVQLKPPVRQLDHTPASAEFFKSTD